ncbi:MAG: transposase [Sphingomonadales bacterium]|nr:transposase [Sphingomonadales bacterium]
MYSRWLHPYFRPQTLTYARKQARLRHECANTHWFLSLADASGKVEAWRLDYNECRPHTALDWMTPADEGRRLTLKPDATDKRQIERQPFLSFYAVTLAEF